VVSPVGFDDADSTNNSFDGVEQVLYRFVYIAAGDSIPGGMDTGTGDCPHNVPDCNGDASKAYPAALAEQYAASIGTSFAVSNISCSGATSSQFLGGGDKCGSLQGRASQYLYLLAHPADLITITVGADDYVLPAASRCLDEAKNAKEKFKWLEKCSKNALAKEKTPLKQTAANLEKILNWVVVAQPTASIVVTGYYDPLPQSVARLTCNGDPTFGTVFCNFLNSDVVDPLNAFFKNANQGIADLNTALSTVVGRYSAQTAGRVKFAPINQQFIGHCSAMQLQGVGLLGWVDFDLGCSASSTWIAPAAPIEVLSASSTFGTASLTFRPGVHPNQTGHKCIASVVLRLLVPASPSRCS
jgi:lysophospholipase L1-like esterase